MIDIKQATSDATIQWAATSLWFNYNSREDSTSFSHTKDVSWKVKSSTKNLPMLNILNRNYPKIIKNRTTCLLCTQHDHIWNCSFLFPHVKQCFLKLANDLETLFTHTWEQTYYRGDGYYQNFYNIWLVSINV